jgi:hypothetical protein
MFDRCFRCGGEGHARRNCPQQRTSPPAPATPAGRWINPPPPANPHIYQSDHHLLYACPWCGSAVHNQCINVGTGRERVPHQARLDLLGTGTVSK